MLIAYISVTCGVEGSGSAAILKRPRHSGGLC